MVDERPREYWRTADGSTRVSIHDGIAPIHHEWVNHPDPLKPLHEWELEFLDLGFILEGYRDPR